MIRHNAVRNRMVSGGRHAGELNTSGDQITKQIGFIIVVLTLEYRGNTLQSHACIDARLGQLDAFRFGNLLILHEYQIPDFDEAVAVLVDAARWATGDIGPVIIEYFRARTAGSSITHGPKIVRSGNADDATVGQTCHLAP